MKYDNDHALIFTGSASVPATAKDEEEEQSKLIQFAAEAFGYQVGFNINKK